MQNEDTQPLPRYSKSRKGTPGYGRPQKYGCPTKMARIPADMTSDEIASLRELKEVIGCWREFAESPERGKSPRVEALLAFLDDAKNLGF